MTWCKAVQCLFSLLPLHRLRDFLIRHHIQKCPRCQKELAEQKNVLASMVQESDFEDLVSIWPAVRKRLDRDEEKYRALKTLRWRWRFTGLAAVILLVAFISVLVFFSNGDFQIMLKSGFKIHYARIENQPARTLLYQPKDSDMIIIWVEKKHEREMLNEN